MFPKSPCLGAGSFLHYFKDSGTSFCNFYKYLYISMSLQSSVKLYFMLLSLSQNNYLQHNVSDSNFMINVQFLRQKYSLNYSILTQVLLFMFVQVYIICNQHPLLKPPTTAILQSYKRDSFLPLPIQPWHIQHVSFLSRRRNSYEYVSRLCQECELLSVWSRPYYKFIFTQLKASPHQAIDNTTSCHQLFRAVCAV